jgi:hypothetical protein
MSVPHDPTKPTLRSTPLQINASFTGQFRVTRQAG